MIKVISKCNHGLKGEISIPSDKSISHRAMMLALLAKGKILIKNFSKAQDPLSTQEVCKILGANVQQINNNDIEVISSGKLTKENNYLNCGNSGTTMRLMSGILASQKFNSILIGDESLSKRPMKRIIEPLTKMGAIIYSTKNLAPLYIEGHELHGIDYISSIASAQVKSCILFAGLNANGQTKFTEPTLSRNHTELMLSYLGADININGLTTTINPSILQPKVIEIPGDISSAAFFIAAALIVPKSEIILKNVGLNPTRTGILEIAKQMGADIEVLDKRSVCSEVVGDLKVKYSDLKSTTIQGEIIPKLIDELPIIAVMATQAQGTTIVKNAEELRCKESDRIKAIVDIITKLGGEITETQDGFIIQGKTQLKGDAAINTYSDHRLAMSAYIAGLICEKDISINNFECIDISFPEFEQFIQQLCM